MGETAEGRLNKAPHMLEAFALDATSPMPEFWKSLINCLFSHALGATALQVPSDGAL